MLCSRRRLGQRPTTAPRERVMRSYVELQEPFLPAHRVGNKMKAHNPLVGTRQSERKRILWRPPASAIILQQLNRIRCRVKRQLAAIASPNLAGNHDDAAERHKADEICRIFDDQ